MSTVEQNANENHSFPMYYDMNLAFVKEFFEFLRIDEEKSGEYPSFPM